MATQNKKSIKNKKIPKVPFWKTKKVLIALIPLVVFIAIYFLYIKKSTTEPEWVKEGEVTFLSKDDRRLLGKIDVEVAIHPAERQQGLMFRTQMDENNGMIFIFEKEDMQAFWMKNTILPLDILFIDSRGVINTIHKKTVPYSEKSLPSKGKSQFVVEVNGGYCDKYGIKEGDLIEYKLDHK